MKKNSASAASTRRPGGRSARVRSGVHAKVAEGVTGADGVALLRSVVAAPAMGPEGESARDRFLAVRSEQLQACGPGPAPGGGDALEVLEVLEVLEALDGVLAPIYALARIYVRVLCGVLPLAPDTIEGLTGGVFARRPG